MKYILLSFFFVLCFCNVQSRNDCDSVQHKRIIELSLMYNEYENGMYFMGNEMGDDPDDFLTYQKENIFSINISDMDTLLVYSDLLSKTRVQSKEEFPFDTDIVAIVKNADFSVDTLGFSVCFDRGFVKGGSRFVNPELGKYTSEILANRDDRWKEIKEETSWKGTSRYYGAPIYDVTLDDDICPNYGLFHNTPAELLAKYMAKEMYDSIASIISTDPDLMYSRDRNMCYSIIQNAILFQQDSIVHLFLDHGFDPNRQDQFPTPDFLGPTSAFESPLMTSCSNSHCNKCGFLLINYGADVNANYAFLGIAPTPLWIAISSNNYEMVQYLINHGANIEDIGAYSNFYGEKINHNTQEMRTALDFASSYQHPYKMLFLLLSNGANYHTPFIESNGGIITIIEREEAPISPSDEIIRDKIRAFILSRES